VSSFQPSSCENLKRCWNCLAWHVAKVAGWCATIGYQNWVQFNSIDLTLITNTSCWQLKLIRQTNYENCEGSRYCLGSLPYYLLCQSAFFPSKKPCFWTSTYQGPGDSWLYLTDVASITHSRWIKDQLQLRFLISDSKELTFYFLHVKNISKISTPYQNSPEPEP